jgi:hypothetical protein
MVCVVLYEAAMKRARTLGRSIATLALTLAGACTGTASGDLDARVVDRDARAADRDAAGVDRDARVDVGGDGGTPARDGGPGTALDAAVVDGGGTRADTGPRPDAYLPPGSGWIELSDTLLRDLCPDPVPGGVGRCAGIIDAWNGGIADTDHDRLIVWGGGHNDYWGNEVYALDLTTHRMVRLTDPSPTADCVTTLPDGRPSSRHTYDSLAYIAHARRMFVWGGAIACSVGGGSDDTWTFDLDTLEWHSMSPSGDAPAAFIGASDYDPETGHVLMHNTHALYSYDLEDDRFTELAEGGSDYHMVGRIDLEARLFVLIGGGQAWAFDLDDGGRRSALTLEGCDAIVSSAYPGLAWDPVERRLVGWAGGDTVYLVDPVAESCEARTFEGGPGPQQPNGTNGRFRYFGSIDAFALVNAVDQNAFLLRLRGAD